MQGVIAQKNNFYALRILGDCGEFSTNELISISQIANIYGNKKITATARGTIEIEQIPENNLSSAIDAIKQANLKLGGTGTTIRAIVACKGSTCNKGLFDVHALASELNTLFFGLSVPKKLKIGVFGCINSLGKQNLKILVLCQLLNIHKNLNCILADYLVILLFMVNIFQLL